MKNSIFKYGIVALACGAILTACDDDDNYFYTTDPIISSVVTGDASTTATTATVTGSVSDLSSMTSGNYSVGAVYSTTSYPTAGGTMVAGSLEENGTSVVTLISGLQDGVTYYYATYVTLNGKVTEYGDVKSFVTTSSQIGTAEAATVTPSTAVFGGTVNGVSDLLESGELVHGFKYAADPAGIETGIFLPVETATNSYTATASCLVPNTTYYYSAYMELNGKPVYGDVKSFKTVIGGLNADDAEGDYVEMGTSVQWARYNLGAEKEGEHGGLYGYGDVTGLKRSADISDYVKNDIAQTDLDVAMAAGAGYLPTPTDFRELLAVCDVEAATADGVDGVKLTSRLTGNSLFFPTAGSRTGEEVSGAGEFGLYMTGNVNDTNNEYSLVYKAGSASVKSEMAKIGTGMSVRPVRKAIRDNSGIDFNPYKCVMGDLEGNGNFRVEIYNEYGATHNDAPINVADVKAQVCMSVTFEISGVGNEEYEAYLAFADADWYPSNWGYNEDGNGSCIVKGDGEYTLRYYGEAPMEGAMVFCVDIKGLSAAVGAENVNCMVKSIRMDDFGTAVDVNPFKVVAGDLEGNGKLRLEIYNEFGATNGDSPIDPSLINFGKYLKVDFKVEGITTPGEYKACLAYADADWNPSNWNYNEDGNASCIVTGDGTYSVIYKPGAECLGAVVFCIDIEELKAKNPEATGTVTGIRQL